MRKLIAMAALAVACTAAQASPFCRGLADIGAAGAQERDAGGSLATAEQEAWVSLNRKDNLDAYPWVKSVLEVAFEHPESSPEAIRRAVYHSCMRTHG